MPHPLTPGGTTKDLTKEPPLAEAKLPEGTEGRGRTAMLGGDEAEAPPTKSDHQGKKDERQDPRREQKEGDEQGTDPRTGGDEGTSEEPPRSTRTFVTMKLDAKRNGTLTSEGLDQWTWGAHGSGAIVPVNLPGGTPLGRAPLRLDVTQEAGSAPASAISGKIQISAPGIRIFRGDEILLDLGQTTADLGDIPASGLDLTMEAVAHDKTREEPIQITFTATVDGEERPPQRAKIRKTPWMMLHHLHPAQEVYVVDWQSVGGGVHNQEFRQSLARVLGPLGVGLRVLQSQSGDRWAQDAMEFSVSSTGTGVAPSVLKSPRVIGMVHAVPTLGLPMVESSTVSDSDPNRFGNLEVTPPCKDYPFGRIYHGTGTPAGARESKSLQPEIARMLDAQIVQKPFTLDTGWLDLGHVDEAVTFVPSSSEGWKACVPDTLVAGHLVAIANKIDGDARILHERTLMDLQENKPQPFNNKLADLLKNPRGLGRTLGSTAQKAQIGINRMVTKLKGELEITDARFIKLPVLFWPGRKGGAAAFTGNVVNALVLGNHVVMARPFGPTVDVAKLRAALGDPEHGSALAGYGITLDKVPGDMSGLVDLYELYTTIALANEGLTAHFVDTWDAYHNSGGGCHCATNTRRRTDPIRWWEIVPKP